MEVDDFVEASSCLLQPLEDFFNNVFVMVVCLSLIPKRVKYLSLVADDPGALILDIRMTLYIVVTLPCIVVAGRWKNQKEQACSPPKYITSSKGNSRPLYSSWILKLVMSNLQSSVSGIDSIENERARSSATRKLRLAREGLRGS